MDTQGTTRQELEAELVRLFDKMEAEANPGMDVEEFRDVVERLAYIRKLRGGSLGDLDSTLDHFAAVLGERLLPETSQQRRERRRQMRKACEIMDAQIAAGGKFPLNENAPLNMVSIDLEPHIP